MQDIQEIKVDTRDSQDSKETPTQISVTETASFIREHIIALRKIAAAAEWPEMVYYLEMASTEAEMKITDPVGQK